MWMLFLNLNGLVLYKSCFKYARNTVSQGPNGFSFSVLHLSPSLHRYDSLMLASCGQSHTLKGLRSR